MKRICALLVIVCVSGCGGTLILHSDTGSRVPRSPVPVPAPCRDCHDVDRDEAVRIVVTHAKHQHVDDLHVKEVSRKKHEWRVEIRGTDACGERVEVRARVDRSSGDLTSFKVKSNHHGKHRHHHDGHHEG